MALGTSGTLALDYEEAMARVQGRKKKKCGVTVEDVLDSIILAVRAHIDEKRVFMLCDPHGQHTQRGIKI